ncbi:MAG: hypothetical protein KDD64_12425 [Bdellovibrionales bacterium]|nr:hypothetical protein [Bdellovibrionales bacterium]
MITVSSSEDMVRHSDALVGSEIHGCGGHGNKKSLGGADARQTFRIPREPPRLEEKHPFVRRI